MTIVAPRSSPSAELLSSPRVAPSILAADYSRLGAQLGEVLAAGARIVHVDVMDGHFVPPITIGAVVVDAIREQVHDVGGILDVHLMVERPERHVDAFVHAGADVITVHAEATPHVHYALERIREAGCRAGLALNPATPVAVLDEVIDALDLVLCMSVNPGWGGQSFIGASVDKLARLRSGLPAELPLEVDGGVNERTAGDCALVGATLLVAGSAVFGAPDPAEAFSRLSAAIELDPGGRT